MKKTDDRQTDTPQVRSGTDAGRSVEKRSNPVARVQRQVGNQALQRQQGGMSHESGQSRTTEEVPPVIRQSKKPSTVSTEDWQTPLDMNWVAVTDRQEGDVNLPGGETGVMHGGEAFVVAGDDTRAVAPDDVQQFESGDCYLMATLMAVADARPGVIEQMIEPINDGRYEVTFFKRDGKFAPPGSGSPMRVIVEPSYIMGSMPQKEDAAVNGGEPETWVPIIEKAYAIAELRRAPKSSEMAKEARTGEDPDPTGSDLESHERLYEYLDEGVGPEEEKMRDVQAAVTGQKWTSLDPAETHYKLILGATIVAHENDQPVTVAVYGRARSSRGVRMFQKLVEMAGLDNVPDTGHVYWVEDASESEGFTFTDPRASTDGVTIEAETIAHWNLTFFIGQDAS